MAKKHTDVPMQDAGEQPVALADCRVGEWVRLSSGWWRLGPQLAGGVGARPSRQGPIEDLQPDLSQRWPAILDLDQPVLERRRPSSTAPS